MSDLRRDVVPLRCNNVSSKALRHAGFVQHRDPPVSAGAEHRRVAKKRNRRSDGPDMKFCLSIP
jgi:hypothetical protein